MMKHFYSLFRKLHKWLALLVATQVLIWAVTGILFGFVDSSNVYRNITSEGFTKGVMDEPLTIDMRKVLNDLTAEHQGLAIKKVSTFILFNNHYLHLSTNRGDFYLGNGNKALEISSEMAMRIANRSYVGPGALLSSEKVGNEWLVSYADELETKVIVSASSGKVIKHYNSHTAFNELLKLLHFMDYKNEHKFDHWWLQIVAMLSFILSLTGCYWVYELLKVRVKRKLKAL